MKKLNINNSEDKSIWIERILLILLLLSISCNVILALLFIKLTPLKKVEPFYISMNNYADHILHISTGNYAKYLYSNKEERMKFLENMVRKYVINRESFSLNTFEMKKLWGAESDIFYMSSDVIFKQFVANRTYKLGLNNPDRKNRKIEISEIISMQDGNVWEVKGKAIDTNEEGMEIGEKNFKIELNVEITPEKASKRTQKNQWKNPLGFFVSKYEYEDEALTY